MKKEYRGKFGNFVHEERKKEEETLEICEDILKTSDFTAEQQAIEEKKLGGNHVYFLPYLMGERSPINDTAARGTFWA